MGFSEEKMTMTSDEEIRVIVQDRLEKKQRKRELIKIICDYLFK